MNAKHLSYQKTNREINTSKKTNMHKARHRNYISETIDNSNYSPSSAMNKMIEIFLVIDLNGKLSKIKLEVKYPFFGTGSKGND